MANLQKLADQGQMQAMKQGERWVSTPDLDAYMERKGARGRKPAGSLGTEDAEQQTDGTRPTGGLGRLRDDKLASSP